jgi:hypothetical protein
MLAGRCHYDHWALELFKRLDAARKGAGPATFMSLLPPDQVLKLMVLVRMAVGEHPPEEQNEALEKFCAEGIAEYLANPLKSRRQHERKA